VNRRIRDFFDGHAARWDECMSADHTDRLERILNTIDIEPGQRVLDVGAGNGVLIPLLERRLAPRGTVVSIDIAGGMLLEARRRYPRALLAQTDVLDLSFAREAFDWVLCNSCFPHFTDPARALAELTSALKAGGQLLVCHTRSREVINEHHRHVGDVVGGHEIPTDNAMRALMAAAGLQTSTSRDDEAGYFLLADKAR